MKQSQFASTGEAITNLANLVPPGRRFSQADVATILRALDFDTSNGRRDLADLQSKGVLVRELAPQLGAWTYHMERRARDSYKGNRRRAEPTSRLQFFHAGSEYDAYRKLRSILQLQRARY